MPKASGLKATGIFLILLSQDGFETDRPEKNPKEPLRTVTSEVAVRRCSLKKVFLEISQHPQENNCVRVSF